MMGSVWEWVVGGIGHFLGALKLAIAGLVGRVLGAFGLSIVTFNGILPDLKAFVASRFADLPPTVTQLAGAVGLDIAMTMVVSALSVRLAWSAFIVPTSVKNSMQGTP